MDNAKTVDTEVASSNLLNQENQVATIPCRLCNYPATFLFNQLVLNRWNAAYYRCPSCDLIQSEKPRWLAEAYSSAICAADTGIIERNHLTADLTTAVAWLLGIKPSSICCDYGGGHGVFVRMMRDRGFDFRLQDRYAANLFARGFEADMSTPFEMVTAFEVFEHLENIAEELSIIFQSKPAIVLAGTQLHRGHQPGWWYYTPATGQHIAFYSDKTMQHIAERFGYTVSGSRAYTLFLRKDLPTSQLRQNIARRLVQKSKGNATNFWVKTLLRFGPRFPSRIISDCSLLG